MRDFWQWFWGGFILAFGVGLVRDPLKVVAGCACLGCLGIIVAGAVLSAISWRLGGLGTLLALIAIVAVVMLVQGRRR